MNLTPIDLKKNHKQVSFYSGDAYRFKTGEMDALYDIDVERFYNVTVTHPSSLEIATVVGIYKQLSHEIRVLNNKTDQNAAYSIVVPHGSKLGSETITTIAEFAYNKYVSYATAYSNVSLPTEKVSLFINGYPVTLACTSTAAADRNANIQKFALYLKLYIDTIGIYKLLSKESISVYVEPSSKIGVLFDDQVNGGGLVYKTFEYSTDSETLIHSAYKFKDAPDHSFVTSIEVDGSKVASDATIRELFKYKINPFISPEYFRYVNSLDIHKTSDTDPKDLIHTVPIQLISPYPHGFQSYQDLPDTVDDKFSDLVGEDYKDLYIGQTDCLDGFISGTTDVRTLNYSKTPLKFLYKPTSGDIFINYYTGTVVIETDDQPYSSNGVSAVKLSYSNGSTMSTIWSRGCGYSILISSNVMSVYKGTTISGSIGSSITISRNGGVRTMGKGNSWASSTATNAVFTSAPFNFIGWVGITEQGKFFIKTYDPISETGVFVDLFAQGITRMILPPCAWYTQTSKTATSGTTYTRQWFYLKFTCGNLNINSRLTANTKTTTDVNIHSIKAYLNKLFFVNDTSGTDVYDLYTITGTLTYSKKTITGFDTNSVRRFFIDKDDVFSTISAPITCARVNGQKYSWTS